MRDLGNPYFGKTVGKIWLATLVLCSILVGFEAVPQVVKAFAGGANMLLIGIYIGPRLRIWEDKEINNTPAL